MKNILSFILKIVVNALEIHYQSAVSTGQVPAENAEVICLFFKHF